MCLQGARAGVVEAAVDVEQEGVVGLHVRRCWLLRERPCPGGNQYLTGLNPEVLARVQRNRTVESAGDVRLFQATDTVGEASLDAYHHAERWLNER